MAMQHTFSGYQDGLIESLTLIPDQSIERFADELFDCYLRRGTVFIVGNGGSAATASHFACDLMKGTRSSALPTFRVICPTDSIPGLTAWSNDVHYSQALAEHLAAFVSDRDLIIAISTSGNSPNVLEAVRVARREGAGTLAMTGRSGGKLANMVDFALRVPSGQIEQVEDLHLIVAHCLCVALRVRIQDQVSSHDRILALQDQPSIDSRVAQEITATDGA